MLDYDKQYTRDELWDMSPVDIYNIILNEKYYRTFPKRYWSKPDIMICKLTTILCYNITYKNKEGFL